MWNVYEYRPNDEKVAAMLLVAVVCLVGAFSIGYMLGIRNVHDHGAGTQPIGQQLEQAGTNISNATSGIEQAENHAGKVEAGIGNAQESFEYIQGTVSTSADIIANSKSIIENIRRRGKENKVTH